MITSSLSIYPSIYLPLYLSLYIYIFIILHVAYCLQTLPGSRQSAALVVDAYLVVKHHTERSIVLSATIADGE